MRCASPSRVRSLLCSFLVDTFLFGVILLSCDDSQRFAHFLLKPTRLLSALVGFVVFIAHIASVAQAGRALGGSARGVGGSNPSGRANPRLAQLFERRVNGDGGENPSPRTNRRGWALLVCRGPPLPLR